MQNSSPQEIPHSFVHKTSIGYRMPLEMEVVADDRVRAWLRTDRSDEGKIYVEWRAANIWILRLAHNVAQVGAFAPIDEQSTCLYLRYYHNQVRIPGVGGAYAWLNSQLNRWILRQDERVVTRQIPMMSPSLDGSDVLLASDKPIVAYRRIVQAALSKIPTTHPSAETQTAAIAISK